MGISDIIDDNNDDQCDQTSQNICDADQHNCFNANIIYICLVVLFMDQPTVS